MIVTHARDDILKSVGFLKICTVREAGLECLIYAMHTVYEEQLAEAVLLVNSSNAFSSVNRNIFLHNVEIICPSIIQYVNNSYPFNNRLFITGGRQI